MDGIRDYPPSLNDRAAALWQRGVRLATRLAIAFGLSAATAILIGAAVTDNGLVQLVVTVLAAFGFWIPFAVLITMFDRFFTRRRSKIAGVNRGSNAADDDSWRRLSTMAPAYSHRVAVLRRSLDRSRLSLGKADLDPDAHDLCVLIDRRLPELIQRELDTLPPDDRNRSRQMRELIELIEQFARHCSRTRSGDAGDSGFEAAVLRRRFEDRLGEQQIGPIR